MEEEYGWVADPRSARALLVGLSFPQFVQKGRGVGTSIHEADIYMTLGRHFF
jgi:hypothetical protein